MLGLFLGFFPPCGGWCCFSRNNIHLDFAFKRSERSERPDPCWRSLTVLAGGRSVRPAPSPAGDLDSLKIIAWPESLAPARQSPAPGPGVVGCRCGAAVTRSPVVSGDPARAGAGGWRSESAHNEGRLCTLPRAPCDTDPGTCGRVPERPLRSPGRKGAQGGAAFGVWRPAWCTAVSGAWLPPGSGPGGLGAGGPAT